MESSLRCPFRLTGKKINRLTFVPHFHFFRLLQSEPLLNHWDHYPRCCIWLLCIFGLVHRHYLESLLLLILQFLLNAFPFQLPQPNLSWAPIYILYTASSYKWLLLNSTVLYSVLILLSPDESFQKVSGIISYQT